MTTVKIATMVRRRRAPELPGVVGTARVDARTTDLVRRLRPGDIAVIDHLDLDKVSADALVAAKVAAVVNASPSSSGRYPNLGPGVLVEAGVPVLDGVGPEVLRAVDEGERLRLHDDTLYRDGEEVVAKGDVVTAPALQETMARASAGLAVRLEAFAGDATEYLRLERELLLDGVGLPDVRTSFEGRHALVVVRGYGYKEDLAQLRDYIRDRRPVLVGVDGGADALLEAGHRPDLVLGEIDAVSDRALTCGAEVVVHTATDSHVAGLARLEELGVRHRELDATGSNEALAMLLAEARGADLVVAAGTSTTLVEFLDKGRSGMASTFLTRLRVGGKLVDARAVAELHRRTGSAAALALLLVPGLLAVVLAVLVTDGGQTLPAVQDGWDDVVAWFQGLV